jgi:hypothetical protein
MKFTLREIFLVTLIVALSLGWWLDRRYVAKDGDRRENEAQERVGFWMLRTIEKDVEILRLKTDGSTNK